MYDPYFADNYGVFNPNQIKSVHNEGPFSENNDDIYYHIGQDATYSESAEDAAWVNNAVTVVEEMRKVFPELQVKIATEEDLVGIRYGVTSFVRNGVVYLIPGVETSEEVVLEECLHPLISAVQQSNPVLFDKLFSEAKRKYKRLDNEIQKNYSDELFTDEDRQNELVTQALSKELREIRHNKEGVVTKLVGMFHQFVQNILSKLGIGIKDGKSTIKPQDLPNILSLKKLAKLINTQNTKFELQIDNRI